MSFSSSVTMVTGGTGQLGRVVVRRFAEAGSQVVVPYRTPGKWEELQAELGPLTSRVDGLHADLIDEATVQRAVAQALARHGRIDHLLCLAGGFAGGRFLETGIDLWEQMLALNLRPTLLALHAVLPHLVERGSGRVVTVGARQAVEPSAGAPAYAASKAAVIVLTQSLARELRGTGVTINCIVPSTIDTETNRRTMPKADPTKWVKPEEVAALLLFLCSPEAEAINGAVIPIYGKL
ncbi:SDR family oxidoreductase [Thermomicrobiaceae bacterium CFH 74404]|uniref:SDR family oxidoreductase n=1 Tax=Thermalbibacter longus TaxID=2951981 RepID=A0AA42BCN5_9BACT|nr:SDR family NAD(P)-dependent oxidoreductase [Thermalbibacter longus]MCM8748953.1 SDR family oxidoreductase [Thermalbibacter longus]